MTTEKLLSYSPHRPWAKQELFLELDCLEALYGGAAGGGKSDALLMAYLQYVHVPKYSGLILRKDSQRLKLAGGLIPRSHEWLHNKATWNGTDKMWKFPNGATLQFGYLETSMDKFRYGSSEYQYIAFDELTEFAEEDYLFMFSRLRKTRDIEVPYRVRGASNPGGSGHEWVKARFVTPEAERDLVNDELKEVYWKKGDKGPSRGFVPAKVRDNPAVDPEEYIENLMHLPPVLRERLMAGDWTIMPEGLIRPGWLRYYVMRDRMIDLLRSQTDTQGNMVHTDDVLESFHENECMRFITVDTAGGTKQIVAEAKGKAKSWTAMGVWFLKHFGFDDRALICRQVVRGRWGFVEVCNRVRALSNLWNAPVFVEDKTMGPDMADALKGDIQIQTIGSGIVDKVVRSAPLQNMLSRGQVYLPKHENSWRPDLEAEWLRFQGLDNETNDQVDMAAYAAIVSGSYQGMNVVMDHDPRQNAKYQERYAETGFMRW